METAGDMERSAKRQAIGSPMKSALKGSHSSPTRPRTASKPVAHVIHSPQDTATRAVPETPPGLGGADGDFEEFKKAMNDKLKEREDQEHLLIGRVAAAETEVFNLKSQVARLEPLLRHAGDFDIFAKIKHLVTEQDVQKITGLMDNEILKLRTQLDAFVEKLNVHLITTQADVERIKIIETGFHTHVDHAFTALERDYKELKQMHATVVQGGSAEHIASTMAINVQLDALKQALEKVQQSAQQSVSGTPSSSSLGPGGFAQGPTAPGASISEQEPCHGRGADHGQRLLAIETWLRGCRLYELKDRVAKLEAGVLPGRDPW